MWKRIVNWFRNWAFEEVEIEVEVPVEEPTKTKEKESTAEHTPFRFPVINDQVSRGDERHVSVKQTEEVVKKSVPVRPLAKDHRPKQVPKVHRPSNVTYQTKKDLKKYEEPAFLRKKKMRSEPATSEHIIKTEAKNTSKELPRFLHGSSPEELDKIFKRKKEETNIQEETEEPFKMDRVISQEKPVISNEADIKTEQREDLQDKVEEKVQFVERKEESNDLIKIPEVNQAVDVPYHLLNDSEPFDEALLEDWLIEQSILLEDTLNQFNVDAKVVNVTRGPTVTSFELQPSPGVKVSRIRNLSDDLKLSLAAEDIRILAPIPGKNTVGIEVPNLERETVSFQEVISGKDFTENESPLSVALGLDVEGNPYVTSIDKMPHGLIAGATGSGKSVCINTILLSLIYKANPDEVKFLLIDPKMIELTPYNEIPHLVSPVITDAKAATQALKWAVNEMESRYELFLQEGVRDIKRYNERVEKDKHMPYLVIVIDELADLMMVAPQEVEESISRIAQKARASGIHMLVATQRPSVDVITGLIKSNIPTRISFSVSSQIDSRTIIDVAGAEKLLGKGDMLFMENGSNKLVRLQGPFVSDEEVERVTHHARQKGKPTYLFEQEYLLELIIQEEEDELLPEVIAFIVEEGEVSTSLLQRQFRIGYNRAARMIDTLENKGYISGPKGSKPRDVLLDRSEVKELLIEQ